MERVGCNITKMPAKSLCAPRVPAGWGEKEYRRKLRMSLTLLRTSIPFDFRLITIPSPAAKPHPSTNYSLISPISPADLQIKWGFGALPYVWARYGRRRSAEQPRAITLPLRYVVATAIGVLILNYNRVIWRVLDGPELPGSFRVELMRLSLPLGPWQGKIKSWINIPLSFRKSLCTVQSDWY